MEQPDCVKKSVWVNTCVGVCIAASVPSYDDFQMHSTCDSCKIKEFVEVDVELSCRGSDGPYTKFHRMKAAKSCNCVRCK